MHPVSLVYLYTLVFVVMIAASTVHISISVYHLHDVDQRYSVALDGKVVLLGVALEKR